MHIGGTLVNAVVRIVILAATLALVYFFIIRPVLDTTDKAFESAGSWTDGLTPQVQDSIEEATSTTTVTSSGPSQQKIERLQREIRKVPPQNLSRLNPCITRVSPDVDKMIRCAERLQ